VIFGDTSIIEVIIGVFIGLCAVTVVVAVTWIAFAVRRELALYELAHKERMKAHEYYVKTLEELRKGSHYE